MSDFGDVIHPKARKAYRCEWCGEMILVGELHVKYVGRWEGDFQNWRMHSECYDISARNDELLDGFSPYEHERPVPEPTPAHPSDQQGAE